MKRVRTVLIACAVIGGISFSYAQQKDPPQESKEKVSRELVTLRDSVNIMLGAMNRNSTGAAGDSTQGYQKAAQDLTRYKIQLDKAIDEVVKNRSWNSDIMNRSYQTLSDVRREFKRIKSGF